MTRVACRLSVGGGECRCHTCGATFRMLDENTIAVGKADGEIRRVAWSLLPGPSWPPSTRRKSVCVLGQSIRTERNERGTT